MNITQFENGKVSEMELFMNSRKLEMKMVYKPSRVGNVNEIHDINSIKINLIQKLF